MDFRRTAFLKSCPDVGDAPKDKKKEVILLGKSNVGKSSLLNALAGRGNLAFKSKKAGKTVYLNYYLVDDSFYLVDSPGYGYTEYGSKRDEDFGRMMEGYFSSGRCSLALLLADGRRGLKEDERDLLSLFEETRTPHAVVYTKADQLKQSDFHRLKLEAGSLGCEVLYSYRDKRSVPEIRGYITRRLSDAR